MSNKKKTEIEQIPEEDRPASRPPTPGFWVLKRSKELPLHRRQLTAYMQSQAYKDKFK